VIGTCAATAWRTARKPLWKYVPSPMFANTCFSVVNGCWPSHIAPSPPMCETVVVLVGSTYIAIVWQPMPASARLPSGILVLRPCGQPEQKLGARTGDGPAGSRPAAGAGSASGQPGSTERSASTSAAATIAGEISPAFGKIAAPRSSANSGPAACLPRIAGAPGRP
jgi:hypothetical protein